MERDEKLDEQTGQAPIEDDDLHGVVGGIAPSTIGGGDLLTPTYPIPFPGT